MKGIEMPSNLIVIAVIVLLVLVVLSVFLLSQSGAQMSQADAAHLFNTMCESYKLQDCAWSVTRLDSFKSFLESCKSVYGPGSEEFSCLYKFCCGTAGDLKCEAKCNICSANKRVGLDISGCCTDYKQDCSDVCVECVVK